MPVSLRFAEISVLILIVVIGIGGVAILVASGRSGLSIWSVRHLAPRQPLFAAVLIGLCGLVACVLGILGWTWVCSKDLTRVTGLAVLILLLALTELCIAGWCVYGWFKLPVGIEIELQKSVLEAQKQVTDNDSIKTTFPRGWDAMQEKLECCGLSGPGDYLQSGSIPWSCCDDENGKGPSCLNLHQNGCLKPFKDYILKQIEIIAFAAALHSVFTLTVFFCAAGLVIKLKHDVRREGIPMEDFATSYPLNPKRSQL